MVEYKGESKAHLNMAMLSLYQKMRVPKVDK